MLGLDAKGGEQGKEWELPVLAAMWTAPKPLTENRPQQAQKAKGPTTLCMNIHTPEIQILTENFGPK